MKKNKTCSKCGTSKPLDSFYTDSEKKGGVKHECKDCFKKQRQKKTKVGFYRVVKNPILCQG